jgi:hypothetical protein
VQFPKIIDEKNPDAGTLLFQMHKKIKNHAQTFHTFQMSNSIFPLIFSRPTARLVTCHCESVSLPTSARTRHTAAPKKSKNPPRTSCGTDHSRQAFIPGIFTGPFG